MTIASEPSTNGLAHDDVGVPWMSASIEEVLRTSFARCPEILPTRRFFSAQEWRVLEATVARVAPPGPGGGALQVTPWIDCALAEATANGLHPDEAALLRAAWREALATLDDEAKWRHARSFADIGPRDQDAVLAATLRGDADTTLRPGEAAHRFFRDVFLRTIVDLHEAEPTPADAAGTEALPDLDALQGASPREAEETC